MFTVRHKETGKLKTVYAVTGPNFLLWDKEKRHWYYDAIVNYRPYEVVV